MAISKKTKDRILRLCDYMEALPKESAKHFDMQDFLKHSGDHDHKLPEIVRQKDLHTCGTSACALGWAATMPYFKRLGLELTRDGEVHGDEYTVFDLGSCGDRVDPWCDLFGGLNIDRTPKQWARRARKLVREWERA